MAEVAFDFGAKHTKYAYSIKSVGKCMYGSRFDDLFGLGFSSTKTFTSVLLDDKGQFHSFGLKAEYHYASLEVKNENQKWRLFGQFASALQNIKTISSQTTVADRNGETYSAMKIFSMAIKYLHDHFIADLHLRAPHIRDSEIFFFFIVQDTWTELGKKFIEDAAIKAGIHGGRLHTVFQSEAAVMEYINNDQTLLNSSGHNYIVINKDGDTIFLTELQKLYGNSFKILQSETRACTCREQFILEQFFDKDVLKDIRQNHASVYLELLCQIEITAREIEKLRNDTQTIWVRMMHQLRTLGLVEYLKNNEKMKWDKIRLHVAEIKSWFEEETGKLIELVRNYIVQSHLQNIQSVILLGDITYTVHIQERFAKELSGITVKTPFEQDFARLEDTLVDPDFAMLKGALIQGHRAFVKAYMHAKNDTELEPPHQQYQIVAAFDFGTTFSGYGYSFVKEKTEVFTKTWHSNDPAACLSSLKAPTSVLLDDKGQFHSFGFKAEDTFAALAEENKHSGWRLFRCFKMILHLNKNLSRKSTIEDISGKEHEAMPIFAMAIQSLNSYLMEAIHRQVHNVNESDIRYIITVPAIWDIGAKQFMREAAVQAGICSDRLNLANESEAAALWCTRSNEHQDKISTDSKHIVIDLGGGTADISVYQREADKTVKVIHKASGGAWGSYKVNELFFKYLDTELGNGVLDELRENHLEDYFMLTRDFENKKRSETFVNTSLNMRMPLSLVKLACRKKSHLSLKLDKMRIDESQIKSWFDIPIRPLIEHVKLLLAEDSMKDIQSIILCGGFAESQYVQERLKQELNGINLIIPKKAGLAVLKGAVLFGHNPNILASRVMTHTYGIDYSQTFDDKTHTEDKKVFFNGEWMVRHGFKVFVRANEMIPVDHHVRHSVAPKSPISRLVVYRTLSQHPLYTTDPGCELLGSFTLANTSNIPFKDQEVVVTFMFGHTELLVKAKHMHNLKEEMLTFDCLQ